MLGNYLQQTTSANYIFRCIFFLALYGLNVILIEEHNFFTFRNLSFDRNDEGLEEYFSQYGEIVYSRVVVDPQTEHSKGKDKCRSRGGDGGPDPPPPPPPPP